MYPLSWASTLCLERITSVLFYEYSTNKIGICFLIQKLYKVFVDVLIKVKYIFKKCGQNPGFEPNFQKLYLEMKIIVKSSN